MTFNDITNQLLSKDNCALLIGGALFIDNLHEYVKRDIKFVAKIEQPHKDHVALMIKSHLESILNNYNTARRMPVGSNRPLK